MEIICGIYKITSPTGKIYIGQSVNIYQRFKAYKKNNFPYSSLIFNSIKSHGHEKHLFEIIHVCLKKELNKMEIMFINAFDSFNTSHGLNMKAGGQSGGVNSPQVINKLRKPKPESSKEKYRIAALNRAPVSIETRSKHRINMMGNKNLLGSRHMIGRKHSDETKKKITEKRKLQVMKRGYKIKLSESHAANIRASNLKRIGTRCNSKSRIPVFTVDLLGFKKRHNSIKEAVEFTTVDKKTIKEVCGTGKIKKGFLFIREATA